MHTLNIHVHVMCSHPLFVQLFIYLFHTMEASTAKVSGVHSCATLALCTATDQLAYTSSNGNKSFLRQIQEKFEPNDIMAVLHNTILTVVT